MIDVPEVEPVASAWVDGAAVTFRFPDPGHRLAGVRLSQDVRIPGDLLDFRGAGDGWELTVARPPVTRMEYLFELRYPDGGGDSTTRCLPPGVPRIHTLTWPRKSAGTVAREGDLGVSKSEAPAPKRWIWATDRNQFRRRHA